MQFSLLSPFSALYSHRNILIPTSLRDIKARHIATTFGLAWTVLYPILFLMVYGVVYTMILRIRIAQYTTFDYLLVIFSGLIPFIGFSETLSTSVTSVTENKSLIRNTLFPIELIPIKAVICSSVTLLVGLGILMPLLWIRGMIFPSQLLLPVILGLQFIFSCGIAWLLSAINVFFRDLGQMIGLIILLLMLISPIGYTQDMIPHELMPFIYPNPLYYLIMLYRDTLVMGTIPLNLLLIFTVISFFTFGLGYFIFSKLKLIFADYV